MKGQVHGFFINFLSRSFYIKSHLAERLGELTGSWIFPELQNAISITIFSLDLQLNDFDALFTSLDIAHSSNDCEATIYQLESVFTLIQTSEGSTSLLPLLDYVSIAESLLAQSAKMAELFVDRIAAPYLSNFSSNFDVSLQPLIALLEESIVAIPR